MAKKTTKAKPEATTKRSRAQGTVLIVEQAPPQPKKPRQAMTGVIVPPEQSQKMDVAGPPQAMQQREIFDKMSEPLQKRVLQFENQARNQTASAMHFYYSQGLALLEIDADRAQYGNDAVMLVERYFDLVHIPMRKCRQFASQFSREEFDFFMQLTAADGQFRLTWGHACALMSVPVKDRRRELMMAAVGNFWEVKRLRDEIYKQQGAKDPRNTGKKHKLPPTVESQVRQIKSVSRTWLDKSEKVWDGDAVNVYRNIEDLPSEAITDDLMETLSAVSLTIDEMEVVVRRHKAKLASLWTALSAKRDRKG